VAGEGIVNYHNLSLSKLIGLEKGGHKFGEMKTWLTFYLKLARYHQKHGHCRIAPNYRDKRLRKWIRMQRNKRDELNLQKVRLFNRINFSLDRHDEKWQRYFDMLKAFKKEHGNFNIPTSYSGLYQFVARQRKEYKQEQISSERIRLLKSIGVSFEIKKDNWNDIFKKLQAFKERHGHLRVSERKLQAWSKFQRDKYNDKNLPREKIKKLNSIGFLWTPRKDGECFGPVVDKIRAYYDKHGNIDMIYEKDNQYYDWMKARRSDYRRRIMHVKMKKLLNSMDFKWE